MLSVETAGASVAERSREGTSTQHLAGAGSGVTGTPQPRAAGSASLPSIERPVDDRLPVLAAGSAPVCVALADVDLFKQVNDRFGHPIGDEVLRRIAAIFLNGVRDSDLVARLGGEEFLIALSGLSLDDARDACDLLRARVAAYPWERIADGLSVTISFGGAESTGDDLGLKRADERLYAAKRAGRNRVHAA